MGNRTAIFRRNTACLKANAVTLALQPVMIQPMGKHSEFGKLTLKKENGAVKGFEYECVCGHKDYFVCD